MTTKNHRLASFIVVILVSLASEARAAGRHLIAPQFFWHDWYNIVQILSPGPPQAWVNQPANPGGIGTQRCIDINITNLSTTVSQTVTVTAKTVNGMYATYSAANPTSALSMEVTVDNTTYQPVGATSPILTLTWGPLVVQPATSQMASFCGVYNRNPFHCDYSGDWHMLGAFDLTVDVAEDRGAVTAVLNSRMENTGCQLDTTNSIAALRDTSKTILFNGGRPF